MSGGSWDHADHRHHRQARRLGVAIDDKIGKLIFEVTLYAVWNQLRQRHGGMVRCDLLRREITYIA